VTLKDYEACAYKVLHDSTMGVYPTSGEANDALSIVAKKHVHKLQAETKQIADEAGAASRTAKQAILADAAAEKWLLAAFRRSSACSPFSSSSCCRGSSPAELPA
jgi:hypothetical protein